jgi:1-deoxy-D-xylulose-5-phosphate reductoisomerase
MADRPVNLAVLGATGSIGASTLDVVRAHGDRYRVFALSAHGSGDALLELCRVHRPRFAVLAGMAEERALRARFGELNVELLFGGAALEAVASHPDCDAVMAAIVGAAGLPSTLAAARAGKRVLLANKEALVMAGALVMRAARDSGAELVPVDSEHNAVFQCFSNRNAVKKIILTASGGPFRATPLEKLAAVTPEEACAHPNWVMGRKISVDSATMMNKGLEMIEAHWLFGVEMKHVEVVIHPQSIVHSMVEFTDGSTLAQLSYSNMCFPIQYAVTWPDRVPNSLPPLDFSKLSKLEFSTPRYDDFPALNLARRAGEIGGTLPAVMNAANEIAVAAFLDRQVRFPEIWRIVEDVMNQHTPIAHPDLDAILGADQWARAQAQGCLQLVKG